MDINGLPDLLLEIIFSYLNHYDDLDNVRLVSRRWCCVAENLISSIKKSLLRCSQLTWLLPVRNSAVAKRCSHSSCYHEGSKKVYIFGGCTDIYTTFNDLWSFNLRTRSWLRELSRSGPFPSPRAMAIMVPYKDYLIVHGGFAKYTRDPFYLAANYFNEINMYDTRTGEWIEVETEPPPPTVASHCWCLVKHYLIIFGGSHNSRATNHIYYLDLVNLTWHTPTIAGSKVNGIFKTVEPSPRYGSSCVLIDESHILVVGGCGGPNSIYNDAWLLKVDLKQGGPWEWKQITITNPQLGPSQLWCHSACSIGQNLACISYARKHNEQGHNTISLGSRPAPLYVTSKSAAQLPSSSINGGSHSPFESDPQRNISTPTTRKSSSIAQREWIWDSKCLEAACVYILDTSRVLEDYTATWHQQKIDVNAPNDTLLYSLCVGRGELIMFGGMRNHTKRSNRPCVHTVTNDIYILRPSRYL